MTQTAATRNAVVPGMRYRNAPEAIEWLCRVFGFEKNAVYAQADGTVDHAQLILGGGMIMLGSVRRASEADKYMAQPDETGGRETRGIYLISDRVADIYARARAAGAEIVRELTTESYGGEGFTCRDLEGRIWSVGSYDPWAAHE